MKRVSAYQATDGQVFTDKAACKAHQKNINIVMALRELANDFEKHIVNSPENYGELSTSLVGVEFVQFMAANVERVQAALKGEVKDDVATDDSVTGASPL
jgi:hypothetical protein